MTSTINPQFGKKSPAILQRQIKSLEILAGRVGVSRQALEARTINDTCKGVDLTIEQTRRIVEAFGSFAGLSFDHIKKKCEQHKGLNFWDDIAVREQATHSIAIDAVARIAQHLPIEWSYLNNLAKQHRLPVPTSDRESMTSFLRAIPSAYVFDHEFNAFIEWNIEDLPPCIFYDTLLLNSLFDVALLLSIYLEANASNQMREAHGADNTSRIFAQAALIVDKLLGRKLLEHGDSSEGLTPSAFLGLLGMVFAAQLFVSCHEIAHLLLGHIDKEPDPKLEYEADAFATLVVGSSEWPNKEFGIVSVFALIDIIEAEMSMSTSHPSSLNRLGFVAKQASVMKTNIDWHYVGSVLKCVLDKAAEVRTGRRVFEGVS